MSHLSIVTEALAVTLAAGARIDDGDLTAGIEETSLWRDRDSAVVPANVFDPS